MSVLFLLSNIAVPFLILGFTSLAQVHQNGSYFPAKWFILIMYTFISNMLFYFMSDSSLYLIFDLILKLGIVFIPEKFSQPLEKIIAALHLQLFFDKLRSFLFPHFNVMSAHVLLFVLGRMTPKQQQQFKATISSALQKADNPSAAPIVFSQPQPAVLKKVVQHENRGVTCDLLTMAMLNRQKQEKQLLRVQLSQKKIQPNPTRQVVQPSKVKTESPLEYVPGSMKKKSAFNIQKSNTDIGILDEQQKVVPPKLEHKYTAEHKKVEAKKAKVQPQQELRSSMKSPPKKQTLYKQQQQPSMILNKLDVSEYSDMFDDDEDNPDRKLLVKVQTIIEIAGINTSRLQIYNIELYSNSQLRIVSLYGRQFEKHTLVSMKPLKQGYYELNLQGGKVQTRKVKFRGSFEPFLKYLQPEV